MPSLRAPANPEPRGGPVLDWEVNMLNIIYRAGAGRLSLSR
jgi:hypothetical protein